MRAKPETEQTLDRALALLAIACVAAYDYGSRIWMLCGIAAAVSMLTELAALYLMKIPFRLRHLDAAVCGVILVMLMPPTVSVSLLIMSCIFAIIIGRSLFGGKDHPVIPAAAVGYCFALLNQRAQMTLFPAEKTHLPLFSIDRSALVSGISVGWNHDGTCSGKLYDWLTGLPAQPIGTGSIVLLGVIALILMLRRSASGFVLLPMLGFLMLGNLTFNRMRDPAAALVGTCLTNQTLFAAIFLYADPVYAPKKLSGVLYGLTAAGLSLWLTRLLGVYDAPVLLTVLMTPLVLFLRTPAEAGNAQKGGGNPDDTERTGKTAPAAPESDPH